LIQICLAIKALHSLKIMHRDLKVIFHGHRCHFDIES